MVVQCFDPGVGGVGRQIGAAARFEIHRKEGDVAGDIDPAESGVELDRVEGGEFDFCRLRCQFKVFSRMLKSFRGPSELSGSAVMYPRKLRRLSSASMSANDGSRLDRYRACLSGRQWRCPSRANQMMTRL